MNKNVFKGRLDLSRIKEEVISSFDILSSVSHYGPMMSPMFSGRVENGSLIHEAAQPFSGDRMALQAVFSLAV